MQKYCSLVNPRFPVFLFPRKSRSCWISWMAEDISSCLGSDWWALKHRTLPFLWSGRCLRPGSATWFPCGSWCFAEAPRTNENTVSRFAMEVLSAFHNSIVLPFKGKKCTGLNAGTAISTYNWGTEVWIALVICQIVKIVPAEWGARCSPYTRENKTWKAGLEMWPKRWFSKILLC